VCARMRVCVVLTLIGCRYSDSLSSESRMNSGYAIYLIWLSATNYSNHLYINIYIYIYNYPDVNARFRLTLADAIATRFRG